jgi:hypothetical protein
MANGKGIYQRRVESAGCADEKIAGGFDHLAGQVPEPQRDTIRSGAGFLSSLFY